MPYTFLCIMLLMAGAWAAQSENLPEIKASLGMNTAEVEKKSSAGIRFSKTAIGTADSRVLHALIPHRFIYEHSHLGFALPEAKGISMFSMAGRVEQIDVNPQLKFLNIDAAIERCRELITLLDQKGWKRDRRHFKNLYSGDTLKTYGSLGSIKNVFLDPDFDDKFEGVRLASWKNNVEEIELQLERKRYHEKAPADRYNEKKYLITLTLSYSAAPPRGYRGRGGNPHD